MLKGKWELIRFTSKPQQGEFICNIRVQPSHLQFVFKPKKPARSQMNAAFGGL